MRGNRLFFAVGFCGVFACGSSDAPGGRSSTAGHGGAEAAAAGASTTGGAGSGASAGTASGGTPNDAGGAGAFDAGGAGANFAGAGGAGVGSSQAGGGPQVGCGAGAGGATGGPYVDVTSRYSAATSPQRAPILDGSAELHAEHVFNGTLEDIDAPFIRVTDNCGQPPPGYTYTVDVYAVELVGPGPHRLVVDTCDSELLFTGQVFNPIDTVVMAYQDSDGSNHPLDLDNACPHLLEQADDGCSNYAGPSLLRMSGLHEGTVQIAVTTFGGPPTTPMPYVLHVRSDTSCE